MTRRVALEVVILMTAAAPAVAQSAERFREHVRWCESEGGTHNRDPNNPVCTPGRRASAPPRTQMPEERRPTPEEIAAARRYEEEQDRRRQAWLESRAEERSEQERLASRSRRQLQESALEDQKNREREQATERFERDKAAAMERFMADPFSERRTRRVSVSQPRDNAGGPSCLRVHDPISQPPFVMIPFANSCNRPVRATVCIENRDGTSQASSQVIPAGKTDSIVLSGRAFAAARRWTWSEGEASRCRR